MPLLRFPVTILLAAEYAGLVLVPAVLYRTPHQPFMFGLVAAGLITAFAIEAILRPLGRGGSVKRDLRPGAVIVVTLIGTVATLGATYLGARTYGTQIGATTVGKLATILTPLQPWLLIGPTLGLYMAGQRIWSRRKALVLTGVSVVIILLNSYMSQIYAPAIVFCLGITFGALATGTLRLRWVVISVVAVVLLWPAIFDIRNQGRITYVGNPAALGISQASDRLRLDRNLSLAQDFEAPRNLGQPSLPQMVRYGLIPRALDPDPNRPTISTGQLLNAALGGSARSAFSFTVLGNLYVLKGPWGIVLYTLVVTLVMGLALRRRGPFALIIGVVLVQQCLWIESTYPDGVGAFIQGLTSAAGAFVVATLWRRLFTRSARRQTSRAPIPAESVA